MTTPGFTAEYSFYQMIEHYRGALKRDSQSDETTVVYPQGALGTNGQFVQLRFPLALQYVLQQDHLPGYLAWRNVYS
jgi:hypothetical protein